MATKTIACSRCYTNCLIMHNKEHGYSASKFSFFKIMFGKDFANFMAIPPTFIKRHKPVEGTKIALEDSSGNVCHVILSNVDGSLAFERRWNTFVVDHGIEMGDILMFYLIKESHFMVGIYGRSGCPKNLSVSGERPYKKRVPEVIRQTSYMKRPREHSALRTINARGYSGSDVEVLPKPYNNVRDSSVLARNVPRHRNINERHNAVPAAETLVEPCFMSDRETNTDMEKDRNILLDLSNFEMPAKKRITDREEESDYRLLDFANLELPQNGTDFNQNGKLHEVSDTLQDSEAAMPDKKTHIDGLDVADYLLDMSFFDKPESEDANRSSRVQLHGPTERKEPDKAQTAETEAAIVNSDECHISERKLEEPPLTGEVDFSHERTTISSSPSSAGLPLDSNLTQKVVEPSQTSEFPSPPGCSRLSSQDMEFKQEICGNVVADSYFSASCSIGEPQNISRKDLGERSEQKVEFEGGRATLFKQEARNYNQSFSSNAVPDDCHGMDFPIANLDNINSGYLESLNHVRGDEGGKATLFKQEARDFKQSFSGNAVPDACHGMDFPISKLDNTNSGHIESSNHVMGDEGGKAKIFKQEARDFNQSFSGTAVPDDFHGTDFPIGNLDNINCEYLESLNHVMRDEGGTRKIIKREASEFNPDLCDAAVAGSSHGDEFSMSNQAKSNFGKILGNFSNLVSNAAYANVVVKPEPVDIDLCDTPSVLSSITCTIPPNTDDYLELPEPLPLQAMSSWKQRLKIKQHFVLLCGADDKLWPVVYHHKLKFYVLASGWKSFMKGNNIQSGDLCMFTAEDIQDNTFTVQVVPP